MEKFSPVFSGGTEYSYRLILPEREGFLLSDFTKRSSFLCGNEKNLPPGHLTRNYALFSLCFFLTTCYYKKNVHEPASTVAVILSGLEIFTF